MGVVDEAIQDGVGVGGIADDFVPGGQRELGGDDRRPATVPLFEDFEQIVTGAGADATPTCPRMTSRRSSTARRDALARRG
jgi:hypothetical protein